MATAQDHPDAETCQGKERAVAGMAAAGSAAGLGRVWEPARAWAPASGPAPAAAASDRRPATATRERRPAMVARLPAAARELRGPTTGSPGWRLHCQVRHLATVGHSASRRARNGTLRARPPARSAARVSRAHREAPLASPGPSAARSRQQFPTGPERQRRPHERASGTAGGSRGPLPAFPAATPRGRCRVAAPAPPRLPPPGCCLRCHRPRKQPPAAAGPACTGQVVSKEATLGPREGVMATRATWTVASASASLHPAAERSPGTAGTGSGRRGAALGRPRRSAAARAPGPRVGTAARSWRSLCCRVSSR